MASPEAARNTMSALQRGWQLGRSETEEGSASPPGGYSPSGFADLSGPHQMPATPNTPMTGPGRGPYSASTDATSTDATSTGVTSTGPTDSNPADGAAQRDED